MIHFEDLPTVDVAIEFQPVDPTLFYKKPEKANPEDACFDIFSSTSAKRIPVGWRAVIGTNLKFAIPPGWEMLIRGRSGLASKGIVVHFGTVDSGYHKEVKVVMENRSENPIDINQGDKIAQVTFKRVPRVHLVEGCVEETPRGGFGSTGV